MRAELVSDLSAIEHEWWALWRQDTRATPFQSPAWLIPWAEVFAWGAATAIALREDGRLLALLPIYRHEGRWLLLGAGTSDWLDGVFAPNLPQQALAALLSFCNGPVDLFQLPPHSPLRSLPAPQGWSGRSGQGAPCVSLSLPAVLPARMAKNLHYYGHRAEKAGVGAPETAGIEAFDDLVALHTRRWQERAEPGVLADPRVLAWHRAALPRLAAAGLLRLYALSLEGRVVAVFYGLAGPGAVYYYIGGYEPALETLGLGTILIGHAIAEAERAGAAHFDFLRGQEGYKYHWGGIDRPSYARLLTPPRAAP